MADKEKFQSPPGKFWGRGERPSLTVKLADLTPREWSLIISLLVTFFLVGVFGSISLIYGVKAVTMNKMDRDFLQSGYVSAKKMIEQGGFVYGGKIYAVGESSIMTTPEQIRKDLDDAIKMNKQLHKDVRSLKDSLDYERKVRRPRIAIPGE